ncbi:MAG TPA: glutaminyl-peptide cyclotransferase [Bryobacteraceae bacterium]|jgi:glutamine cyclotransferase|nr:glutaminyl-peptide cyclotransferase [Bryobacteraceae bacterium]
MKSQRSISSVELWWGRRFRLPVWLLCATLLSAATPEYTYKVIHVYPHDRTSFTEGLEYHGGFLYESTGEKGHSVLRKMKLETGEVVQEIKLPPHLFGEGITILHNEIVQLTYQTQLGFVYDLATMKQKRTFIYEGEGWGLTNDGSQIYMDDGSAQIRVWDGATLKEKRRFTVHDDNGPIEQVNELEWVNGEIYSNVWQTDLLLRIAPADGKVLGRVNLGGLLTAEDRRAGRVDVLNGIAYDAAGKRLFVTGKWWPHLFEIQIVPKNLAPGKTK